MLFRSNSLMGQQKIKEVTIIVTHYHWDHISGLPFFVPAFVPGWKVNIYGPGGGKAATEERISKQMVDPYFPVEVETWMADIHYLDAPTGQLEYGPFKIQTFNVHHPGSTYGYHIQVHNKTIIYVSDNELQFLDKTIEDRKDDLEPEELQLMKAMQEEERINAIENIKNAHIFIHDAQYTPEDYAKKRGWGHSCYLDTAHFAMDANVKQLHLFHVDPSYNDTKIEGLHGDILKLIKERQSQMECHIAREGAIIDIDQL